MLAAGVFPSTRPVARLSILRAVDASASAEIGPLFRATKRRRPDRQHQAPAETPSEPRNRGITDFTQPFRSAWEERARAFLLGYPGVTGVREILTTFVGPSRVWIVARVEIDSGLSGAQVESLVRGIESDAKQLEYIYRVDVVP